MRGGNVVGADQRGDDGWMCRLGCGARLLRRCGARGDVRLPRWRSHAELATCSGARLPLVEIIRRPRRAAPPAELA
jgi:hypothetical protein